MKVTNVKEREMEEMREETKRKKRRERNGEKETERKQPAKSQLVTGATAMAQLKVDRS